MKIEEINKVRELQLTEEETILLRLNAEPNPMTYQQIGDAMGYTKQNVFHIIKRAKSKLKEQRLVGNN